MVAWLRGGSKYDVIVDCTDAYISGIWPYMMQIASNPSWVPDAVRIATDTGTTEQVNAQGGNPYNLLKKDNGGYYADTDNEYLYRFGKLAAGNSFAIVGQPTDSKQWFMATWHITSVSGSKVYVDVSTYGILWQTQNPLGIRMYMLGYIKKGVSYFKSKWDSEQGFGTSESLDNTAVHANWFVPSSILVIGKESSSTDGVYRDRAVLESVESVTEGSSVSFFSGSYFDVSPLYGTDGRMNVKPDLLATGIDIKSHKIIATTDNFVVRNNSGDQTFSIDKDGNIVGAGDAYIKGTITGSTINGSTIQSSYGTYTTTIQGGSIMTNNIVASGGSIGEWTIKDGGLTATYGSNAKISLYSSDNFFALDSNNNTNGGYLLSLRNDGGGSLRISCYGSDKAALFVRNNGGEHLAISTFGRNSFISRAKESTMVNQFAYACIRTGEVNVDFDAFFVSKETDGIKYPGNMIVTTNYNYEQTVKFPANPALGLQLIVIQGTDKNVHFDGNGHSFQQGSDVSSSASSNRDGQWNLFIFDGQYWQCVYITGHNLW